jgi:nucleoside-diphosphate-sugar epimerase
VSVLTLAREVVRAAGSRSRIRFAPYQPDGDVRVRVPSIGKAERVLGFQPRIGLDEGLERTVAWYRDVYLADQDAR